MTLHKLSVSNPQRFDVGRANHRFPAGSVDVEVLVSDYRVGEVTACSHLETKNLGTADTSELLKKQEEAKNSAQPTTDDEEEVTVEQSADTSDTEEPVAEDSSKAKKNDVKTNMEDLSSTEK